MEGFSFVTPVTGLSRRNTGKEDYDVLYIAVLLAWDFPCNNSKQSNSGNKDTRKSWLKKGEKKKKTVQTPGKC
jgi:hypothetical protein